MARQRIEMEGQRFGRLLVTGLAGISAAGHRRWDCRCACGGKKEAAGNELRRGRVQSCGCVRIESSTARVAAARAARLGVSA